MPHPNCGITFVCAHCGALVTDMSTESIDPGTRLTCSCGGETVVDLFKAEERSAFYRAHRDMELFPLSALTVLLQPDRPHIIYDLARAKLRDWLAETRH